MYSKTIHSRCDKWLKEERKESMRRISHHEGEGIVILEKGREWFHVGVQMVPRWMPCVLPSSFLLLS